VPLLALLALLGSSRRSNISRPMTDEQDVLEERCNLGAERADEVGEGGEVRGAVARERNEGDLLRQARSISRLLTMPRL
jgi:hypothetical protein